jgi:hypothetical protein
MLIEDNNLNIKAFKDFFSKLDWVRVPRTLTQDHVDYFYIGSYEDEELKVSINIRPTYYMQVFETFKNRTLDGKKPTSISSKSKLVNWSSSVEVKVDDSFMDKVKSVAKDKPIQTSQIVTWS